MHFYRSIGTRQIATGLRFALLRTSKGKKLFRWKYIGLIFLVTLLKKLRAYNSIYLFNFLNASREVATWIIIVVVLGSTAICVVASVLGFFLYRSAITEFCESFALVIS
jgi:hypothetical protein